MSKFKVESFRVFPVCVDKSSPAPVPPQRINPFAQSREDRLRAAMHAEVDVYAVEDAILGNAPLEAPTVAVAAGMAMAKCQALFEELRIDDGKKVVLQTESVAYIPIGGVRHESNSWACLVNKDGPAVTMPWCFSLDQSDQERYDAYVLVRLSVVPCA